MSAGTVYLIGAGPGDPGLLTLRAVELIARADVILHDRLIPAEALAHAAPRAEIVDVGKVGGGEQVPQETTTRLLVEHALAGRSVARLKGGDPFVFGRGGEEALACREHGIPFEVVPGVTAGIAAPAYAGIPVTQRGTASAVAFVTGHEDPEKPESQVDWAALAAFPGTLVFYMGVRQLGRISEALIAAGRAPDEPVGGGRARHSPRAARRRRHAGDDRGVAADAGVEAPAITIVGEVAGLREPLSWIAGARPLAGLSVAVTRARAQASELAARLRALGAEVVEAPAIRIEPLDAELPDVAAYDLLCVTSPNGAEQLLGRVRDSRSLAGPLIAALGPGTARALRERGIEPDVIPERAIAESLVEALRDVPVQRALIARAQDARDVLPDALRERGAQVDVLALYRTVAEPLDEDARAAALGADYATFTSASSARFFREAAGTLDGPRVISIGPVTSDALRELGREPDVEAAEHTPDGLVRALLDDVAARRRDNARESATPGPPESGTLGLRDHGSGIPQSALASASAIRLTGRRALTRVGFAPCASSSSGPGASGSPPPPSPATAPSSSASCSPTSTSAARRRRSRDSATSVSAPPRSTPATAPRSWRWRAPRARRRSSTPATRG